MKKIYIPQGGGRDFWLRIPMNNESAGRHLCMDDVDENEMHVWLESGYGGCWTLEWEKDGAQRDGIAAKVPASQLGYGTYSVVMAGRFVNGDYFRTKRQLFIRLVDREDQADAEETMYNEEKAYWAGPAVLSEMLSRDGLNTYELAVLHGYGGTLEEFLAQAGIELQDFMVTKAKLSREVQTLLDKGAEKGITPMGAYSNIVNYRVNDMVYDATTNSSYISIFSENKGNAVTDTRWWKKAFDGNYVLNTIMEAAQQTLDRAKAATEQATENAIEATSAASAATAAATAAKDAANAVAAQKVAQAQIGYYECNSLGTDATKVTTTGTVGESTYVLTQNGGQMKIRMAQANSVDSNVKLQIGNTTALPLYYNGLPVSASNSWDAGEVISVYYDGSVYQASNAQGGGGKAEKIKYDNSASGLAAENMQGALDNIVDNTNAYSEIDFIAETGSYLSYYISGSNGQWAASSTSYPYYCRILRIDANSIYRITAADNGPVHYALLTNNTPDAGVQATDWNNGIPKTILAGESIAINSGEYTYLYCRQSTSGTVFYYPKKVEKIITVDKRFKEADARIDSVEADITELNGSVVSEPIPISFSSMVRNEAIVSAMTHNWRADNDTDYWHYYFETTPEMKAISIQGNGSEGSYITFVKTYNYEGTPTGTPDYCEGYASPITFPSSSTPNSKVVNIPDDCSHIIINDKYRGGNPLPSVVYVCYDLKSVVEYKDTTESTFNIPMEVGYTSSNNGCNSIYSKDATADNGYAYVSADGKFNQWRNVGMIEVSDGNYTLSFDKGDTCIINYYNSLRELIKREIVDIVNSSISVTVSGARYIRIEVYTKAETYEQDYALEAMYEPKVSITGVFSDGLKVAKLKKQTSTQADTIVTPVWIENVFCTHDDTHEVQDDGGWHIDFGRIALPANYDPDGDPVRLIIYSHGGEPRYNPVYTNNEGYGGDGKFDTTMHVDPTIFLKEGYAVMDMDACFCIFNTKTIDGIKIQGGRHVINCYNAAYDYVVRNYNIRTDGVLLGGRSFGGFRGMQLIMGSKIPIIAAVFHVPYVCEHIMWSGGHRLSLAKHAGFTNYDSITNSFLSPEELEIVKENYPRLLRTSPMFAACAPTFEEFFAEHEITVGGTTKTVSLTTNREDWGKYIVSKWKAKFPVPIKLMACKGDTTASPDNNANILYSVGINGGSDIELRLFTGGSHNPIGGNGAITVSTYVTKYGQTLTNVPVFYVETIRFWRRYEQD